MRHCERSEAIHACVQGQWIASSQGLLAMTGKQLYVIGYISSQALRIGFEEDADMTRTSKTLDEI